MRSCSSGTGVRGVLPARRHARPPHRVAGWPSRPLRFGCESLRHWPSTAGTDAAPGPSSPPSRNRATRGRAGTSTGPSSSSFDGDSGGSRPAHFTSRRSARFASSAATGGFRVAPSPRRCADRAFVDESLGTVGRRERCRPQAPGSRAARAGARRVPRLGACRRVGRGRDRRRRARARRRGRRRLRGRDLRRGGRRLPARPPVGALPRPVLALPAGGRARAVARRRPGRVRVDGDGLARPEPRGARPLRAPRRRRSPRRAPSTGRSSTCRSSATSA